MAVKAESKYLRISPRKAKIVVDLVRGQSVTQAEALLANLNKKSAFLVKMTLAAAIANAANKGYTKEDLYISKIAVNPGPQLKRYRAAAFGRATVIRKRTAHIVVEVDSKNKVVTQTKTK